MSNRPKTTLWNAEPHTVAKIKIVADYLQVWTLIFCRATMRPEKLIYIDGFAGPGEYLNGQVGSPLAAMAALRNARETVGEGWPRGGVKAVFFEEKPDRAAHLSELLSRAPREGVEVIGPKRTTFAKGIGEIEETLGKDVFSSFPVLAFIDPFGTTGVPFSAVQKILEGDRSEIILNFCSTGVARILKSGESANHEHLLDEVFGSEEWRAQLDARDTVRGLSLRALELYKSRLFKIPRINYVYSFEMAHSHKQLDYFLLFASQSSVGLKKMKEVMAKIDQTGAFQFRDTQTEQPTLLRFDRHEDYIDPIMKKFDRMIVTFDTIERFILNDTPLRNFVGGILVPLENRGLIEVSRVPGAKRGTFSEQSVRHIRFLGKEYGKTLFD